MENKSAGGGAKSVFDWKLFKVTYSYPSFQLLAIIFNVSKKFNAVIPASLDLSLDKLNDSLLSNIGSVLKNLVKGGSDKLVRLGKGVFKGITSIKLSFTKLFFYILFKL